MVESQSESSKAKQTAQLAYDQATTVALIKSYHVQNLAMDATFGNIAYFVYKRAYKIRTAKEGGRNDIWDIDTQRSLRLCQRYKQIMPKSIGLKYEFNASCQYIQHYTKQG